MLQQFAATHNVKAVTVLIGANNYGFADIVQTCIEDFLLSPSWWPNYCNDDSNVKAYFTVGEHRDPDDEHQDRDPERAPGDAQRRLRRQLVQDHRADLLVADPERVGLPLLAVGLHAAVDRRLRLLEQRRQLGEQHRGPDDRQLGASNGAAADRARRTTCCSTTRTRSSGRRLCENTVGLLEEKGVANWTSPGAADKTEWVSQVRTTSTLFGPYQLQEDAHPNYWGQLALRNCLRQAYNGGAARGGTCTIAHDRAERLRRTADEPALRLRRCPRTPPRPNAIESSHRSVRGFSGIRRCVGVVAG